MRRRRDGRRLFGIDFGTTHTVVAAVDRGNYPVLSFEGGDFVPSLIAVSRATGEVRYGTAAAAVAGREGWWSVLRSVKRLLAGAGPMTKVEIDGRPFLLFDLLTGYFANLKDEIYRRSNAGLSREDLVQVGVGVPANSLGGQRFLTLDALRRAGFEVVRVLNEPSAAGFEYAHRHGRTLTGRREHVLVYDLGGGTFDASLIHVAERSNEVVTTTGAPRLGGDDFDEAIIELVVGETGVDAPDPHGRAKLLDECRRAKEQITPGTRRFVVDLEVLGLPPLVLPVERIFEACSGLVERTIAAMEPVVDLLRGGEGPDWEQVAGVYTVGGASRFPPVHRRLREIFGQHRVHRSPYPFASTAIGLAVFLDSAGGYVLKERLSRNFGVWREGEAGRNVLFDVIFPRNTPLHAGPGRVLAAERRYRAVHNVGHFRFVECSRVEDGFPAGDLLPWGHLFFPFDPSVRDEEDLASVKVSRLDGEGPEILEEYRCSEAGVISVTITVLDDGFSRSFSVMAPHRGRGQWGRQVFLAD